MLRLFRVLVGVGFAMVLCGSATASASCVTQCTAALTFPDCTTPDIPDYWPTGFEPLSFTAACEDCCAAPGGPVTCTPVSNLSSMELWTQDDLPLAGAIESGGVLCGDQPLYQWSSAALEENGFYRLVFGATIVLEFEVHACWLDVDCGDCMRCGADDVCVTGSVGDCITDADCDVGQHCATDPISPCRNVCFGNSDCTYDGDCGICGVCDGGTCTGSASIECRSDADCLGGATCVIDSFDDCLNRCEGGSECTVDADCGPCALCSVGNCIQTGYSECSTDAECGEGESCGTDPDNPCDTICLSGASCTNDDDCDLCQTCVAGECKGFGMIACTKDSDCLDGQVCKVDAEAPCKNTCVSNTACASDGDCGECQACVGGECMGTGMIVCEMDEDCGAGMVCKVVEPACKNVCVPKGPACTGDADCTGACEACVEGACAAVKDPVCTRDDDCLEGQYCAIDLTNACRNRCEATEQVACTGDEDCPPCSICESGECISLGVVACTKDGDCGEGKVCRVDANDPCRNACEAVCTSDEGCGACSRCVDGRCVAAPQGECTQDEECADGKVCSIDAADACNNRCIDDPNAVADATGADADAVSGTDAGGTPPATGDSGKGCAAGTTSEGPVAIASVLALFAAALVRRRQQAKGDSPL